MELADFRKIADLMKSTNLLQKYGNYYVQVTLAHLRMDADLVSKYGDFLKLTKDLPETAIVVIDNGVPSILLDDEGRLLRFR